MGIHVIHVSELVDDVDSKFLYAWKKGIITQNNVLIIF
jgi:hypothetical protein